MEPDEARPKDTLHVLTREDISTLSLDDLRERIEALKGEILRCERMLESKSGALSSAEQFFRK